MLLRGREGTGLGVLVVATPDLLYSRLDLINRALGPNGAQGRLDDDLLRGLEIDQGITQVKEDGLVAP